MNPDSLLAHLRQYLAKRKLGGRDVMLTLSEKADENNAKKARSFCHVVLGRKSIYCAAALAALPEEFVVGILLHEVAHTIVNEGEDPELDVDEWVLENVPEAGYRYANVKYVDPITGRTRTAKNLERVSMGFLGKIIGD